MGLEVVVQLGTVEVVHHLVHDHEPPQWLEVVPQLLQLPWVSDVTQKEGVVAGVQQTLGLHHLVDEHDGTDHCPAAAPLCHTLKTFIQETEFK